MLIFKGYMTVGVLVNLEREDMHSFTSHLQSQSAREEAEDAATCTYVLCEFR